MATMISGAGSRSAIATTTIGAVGTTTTINTIVTGAGATGINMAATVAPANFGRPR